MFHNIELKLTKYQSPLPAVNKMYQKRKRQKTAKSVDHEIILGKGAHMIEHLTNV